MDATLLQIEQIIALHDLSLLFIDPVIFFFQRLLALDTNLNGLRQMVGSLREQTASHGPEPPESGGYLAARVQPL